MDDLLDEEVQEELEIFDDGDNMEELENDTVEVNQDQDDQNDQDKENEDVSKPVKAKKVVKNPRLTLNAERLKGPKGLGALEGCFERVKFKGKGHEEEDLNVLLKTYEYWAHRLFPKLPFQECIEKIEHLGSKGPIQTYLKKIRSGMEDEVSSTNERLPDFRSDEEEENQQDSIPQTTAQTMIAEDIPVELTEEQLETIRKNREKAEKLRQERLRKIQEKAALNMPESSGIIGASTSRIVKGIEGNEDTYSNQHNNQSNDINRRINDLDDDSDEDILEVSRKRNTKHFEDSSDEEPSNIGKHSGEDEVNELVSPKIQDRVVEEVSENSIEISHGLDKEERLEMVDGENGTQKQLGKEVGGNGETTEYRQPASVGELVQDNIQNEVSEIIEEGDKYLEKQAAENKETMDNNGQPGGNAMEIDIAEDH